MQSPILLIGLLLMSSACSTLQDHAETISGVYVHSREGVRGIVTRSELDLAPGGSFKAKRVIRDGRGNVLEKLWSGTWTNRGDTVKFMTFEGSSSPGQYTRYTVPKEATGSLLDGTIRLDGQVFRRQSQNRKD